MAEQTIEYGVLNVVAHPHGPRAYFQLLEQAARREVNFWGDENGAIRPPREVEDGIYQCEIVIGVEIDLEEPLIDRDSFEAVQADEGDARAAQSHLYNGRVFLLTFVEETHLLVFEAKNEFGKRLSPTRAHRLFSRLFSQEELGFDAPYVEVTIVPDEDALEQLLSIHRLDSVEISLKRPNPSDVHDDEVRRVLALLVDQGAKSQDTKFVRAPDAERIVLSEDNKLMALVAQFNGFVRAKGVTEDGERVDGSTKSYPKIIKVAVDAAVSFSGLARQVAKQIRINERQSSDSD